MEDLEAILGASSESDGDDEEVSALGKGSVLHQKGKQSRKAMPLKTSKSSRPGNQYSESDIERILREHDDDDEDDDANMIHDIGKSRPSSTSHNATVSSSTRTANSYLQKMRMNKYKKQHEYHQKLQEQKKEKIKAETKIDSSPVVTASKVYQESLSVQHENYYGSSITANNTEEEKNPRISSHQSIGGKDHLYYDKTSGAQEFITENKNNTFTEEQEVVNNNGVSQDNSEDINYLPTNMILEQQISPSNETMTSDLTNLGNSSLSPSRRNNSSSNLSSTKNHGLNNTTGVGTSEKRMNEQDRMYYGVHDPNNWAVLQAILSEADDSNDDFSNDSQNNNNHNKFNPKSTYNKYNENDFDDDSTSYQLSGNKSHTYQSSHDALLMEQLLMEDDNSNDYDDSFNLPTNGIIPNYSSVKKGYNRASEGKNNNNEDEEEKNFSVDVDAILMSMGDSSDEEDGDYLPKHKLQSPYYSKNNDDDVAAFDNMMNQIKLMCQTKTPTKRSSNKSPVSSPYPPNLDTSNYSPSISNPVVISPSTSVLNSNNFSQISPNRKSYYNEYSQEKSSDQNPELITANSLKTAENYESRLLRPGQREIISPLMVKRRMKPKIELMTKSRQLLMQQKSRQSGPSSSNNKKTESNAIYHLKQTTSTTSNTVMDSAMSSSMDQNLPKFDITGVVQTHVMPKISSELHKNALSSNSRTSVGLPTALSFNSKFIAVGTQRGIILVFDLFEVLRQKLGADMINATNNASNQSFTPNFVEGSVTSIDLSGDGETLIAGYTSGAVILWNIFKGSILKSVNDAHPSPITCVRFLRANKTDPSSVVSVDAGGLVNKFTFSKSLLSWTSSFSVESECLLDGSAGQILAISVLSPPPSLENNTNNNGGAIIARKKEQHHPSIYKLVLIALSSERSSFAVAVEPSVNVLHRWPRPGNSSTAEESKTQQPDQQEPINTTNQQTYLPCLVWGWGLVSGMGHLTTPILARAWESCIQLLIASFPQSINSADDPSMNEEDMLWPAFGIHDEFDTSAPVVALEWLGERSLVYLTATNEFTVVDTVMMTLLERLDFSGVKLVYAEFSLSRSSSSMPAGQKPSNQSCTTFQNSFRSNDNRLIILCQEEIRSLCILGTRQRISTLEVDGEWLEALALALDHYESTIKSLEDKQKDRTKNIDKHPEFFSIQQKNDEFGGMFTEDEEWIADLLLRYLKLAVENAPESSSSFSSHHASYSSAFRNTPTRIDLAQSHFQMLAGVCIEFCVVTRRLDLLFGTIFRSFQAAHYTSVFLDVLEPYVLNDKLHYIAPEAMAQFIDHCKASNDVATVERCLLHMDVTILDFDSILSLLRKNGMYSALLHVFAKGLNDFITPLEILLDGIFDAAEECDIYAPRRNDGAHQSVFEQYGYKAILYIKHCFMGLTFPQGAYFEDEDLVSTLRPQILQFLLQNRYNPSGFVNRSKGGLRQEENNTIIGKRSSPYSYLNILIMVDAKAVLDVLSLALDAPDAKFVESTSENVGGWCVEVDVDTSDSPQKTILQNSGTNQNQANKDSRNSMLCPDRQLLVSILSSIILPLAEEDPITATGGITMWQAQAAKNAFLDFMAKYLLTGVVTAPKPLTFAMLSRMSERAVVLAKTPTARREEQEQIIALLEVIPAYSFDRDEVLEVVESAGITRAALLLHKEAVAECHKEMRERPKGGENAAFEKKYSNHFVKAIECYLQDEDSTFQHDVYKYIKKECTEASLAAMDDAMDTNNKSTYGNSNDNVNSNDASHRILLGAFCEKLPSIIHLNAISSAQLVAEIFVEELDFILNSIQGVQDGKVLFQFLNAIISGDLAKEDPVAGPVLNANLSIDHHRNYLAIMAKFHPEMVYHHLCTHGDNYGKPEECLKLCQEYEIADASAYLLERMGNVSSALQLMLQTLEGRMMVLKRIIRSMPSVSSISIRANLIRKKKNGDSMISSSMDQQAKEIQSVKQILVVALDLCERNSSSSSTMSSTGGSAGGPIDSSRNSSIEHGSQLWFNVLDRLINAKGFLRLVKELPEHAEIMQKVLSELLQLTMQRMVSNVLLPDLVHKITTDHSGNRLGEFREMIVSMLKTYSLELEKFSNAADIMYLDVKNMSIEKRNLKLKGLKSRSLMGIPLGKSYLSKETRLLDTLPSPETKAVACINSKNGNTTLKLEANRDDESSGIMLDDVGGAKNKKEVREALRRLNQNRNRRRRVVGGVKDQHQVQGMKRPSKATSLSSLSMMTWSDKSFVVNMNELAEPRYIGVLPGPEHIGTFSTRM